MPVSDTPVNVTTAIDSNRIPESFFMILKPLFYEKYLLGPARNKILRFPPPRYPG